MLGALLSGGAGAALAAPPAVSLRPAPKPAGLEKSLVPTAEALIGRARIGEDVSFVVADARTGLILEARRPMVPQPPASTAKALTALYGLNALGADHRFVTRLVATGPLRDGRIEGDLVLVGSGDPLLDTDTLGDMAGEMKEAGVREVAGSFRVAADALPLIPEIDPTQPDHVGYNPAISGVNLNFNRVHFEWKRAAKGYTVSMDARAGRFSPGVSVARMRVVDRRMPVYTYSREEGGADDWTVARGALGQGGARWLPVRRPDLYASDVFRTLARSHGIVLEDGGTGGPITGTTLVERRSAPLRTILRSMLKYSTNLTAEVVGLSATRARNGAVAGLATSAAKMSGWLGEALGAPSADFVDHSGLSDASRICAADMARALVSEGPDGRLRGMMKDIAVPDTPGVTVQAKTGTLNFVSALTGYVTAPDGSDLAFVIFTADKPRRAALSPAERERPKGGRAWAGRSRRLQRALIGRWAVLYGT